MKWRIQKKSVFLGGMHKVWANKQVLFSSSGIRGLLFLLVSHYVLALYSFIHKKISTQHKGKLASFFF